MTKLQHLIAARRPHCSTNMLKKLLPVQSLSKPVVHVISVYCIKTFRLSYQFLSIQTLENVARKGSSATGLNRTIQALLAHLTGCTFNTIDSGIYISKIDMGSPWRTGLKAMLAPRTPGTDLGLHNNLCQKGVTHPLTRVFCNVFLNNKRGCVFLLYEHDLCPSALLDCSESHLRKASQP